MNFCEQNFIFFIFYLRDKITNMFAQAKKKNNLNTEINQLSKMIEYLIYDKSSVDPYYSLYNMLPEDEEW